MSANLDRKYDVVRTRGLIRHWEVRLAGSPPEQMRVCGPFIRWITAARVASDITRETMTTQWIAHHPDTLTPEMMVDRLRTTSGETIS